MTVRSPAAQVLGKHELQTGLPEARRSLLLAKSVNIDALLADAGGKAGEIAIRRNQTKSIEPAAMEQVHGVDNQRDIGRIFPGGVGKLLLRYDGVLRQRVGPALGPRTGEVAIDAANACLADLRNLREK